jgi:hypothetical protein
LATADSIGYNEMRSYNIEIPVSPRMTLNVQLSPDLEQRLATAAQRQGIPVGQYAARVLEQHVPRAERAAELVAILQSWIDSGDEASQRESGDFLIRALDEDRLSDRPLFPQELKGVSW